MSSKDKIADLLLERGCVQFSPERPFEYASGLKGPLYCDNRILLSYTSAREAVIDAFIQELQGLEVDKVVGIATAGIPYAAIIAHHLKKPLAYVRPKPKAHGQQGAIEGSLKPNDKVVVFEDLINQGSSSAQALHHLLLEEVDVKGLFCIVTYQMAAAQAIDVPVTALTDLDTLMARAQQQGLLTAAGAQELQRWRENPTAWTEKA